MIAQRLKQLRKSKGISQRELAEILGVRKTSVSLYETDKTDPSDPIKITLAKYFDVSLDYLICVIDEKVPYYKEDNFIQLPANVTEEEKELIRKFIDYIVYIRDLG